MVTTNPFENCPRSMSDILPMLAALLGLVVGVKSRYLPASGPVALALQAFPLVGYYLAIFHCHS